MKALQTFGAVDGLSGMLEWSEPVIFDCLSESYRTQVGDGPLIGRLARQHGRAWRALIAGDMRAFAALRGELAAALEKLGVGFRCIVDADARALAELHEIVAARFRRSARQSHAYRLALIELAERLAPSVQAA